MIINIGDQFRYAIPKNGWPNSALGDMYKCTGIDVINDTYELQSIGQPISHYLYVKSFELQYHFIQNATVTSIPLPPGYSLPPGAIQYIPPTRLTYSTGDKLILMQFHQSMPSFVNLGDECVITRVTSQPLVLFDLNETRTNKYIGSFSENELNKWFMLTPKTISTQLNLAGNFMGVDFGAPIKNSFYETKPKECDCGAKKTYGEQCNEFSHAQWCDTLKKD